MSRLPSEICQTKVFVFFSFFFFGGLRYCPLKGLALETCQQDISISDYS